MTGGRSSRLRRLEGQDRYAQHERPSVIDEALVDTARRLAHALPEDQRQAVEAGGVRALAELLEASWEVGRPGEGLNVTAGRAYRAAFLGVRS